MKAIYKLVTASAAGILITTANAGGISGALDGMFTNVTAPDVVSGQFGGSISGGSVYVRTPIANLTLMSFDPPRLSAGCGGIDAYGGAWSYINGPALSAFMRKVAANAGPLAFKMALDATFPQLGGVLDVFNNMAREMANAQKSSCDVAKGMLSAASNPSELGERLTKSVDELWATAKGWSDDFSGAVMKVMEKPSELTRKTQAETNPDGTPAEPKTGNLTWNSINTRVNDGIIYAIADDPHMSKQILMNLIGTKIVGAGATDDDPPIEKPIGPNHLRLKDLFKPPTLDNGMKGVAIWDCGSDTAKCLVLNPGVFQTTGIEGYVRKQMYGSETNPTAAAGSIIYKMQNCTSGNCAMTTNQLAFLNSLGSIPAIGLMMHAQANPTIITMIAPKLVDLMVDEISVVYSRMVIDAAVTTFSNTDAVRPDDYPQTITNLMADMRDVELSTKDRLKEISVIAAMIDTMNRSFASAIRYR